MNIHELWLEALKAAQSAQVGQVDNYPCGFGWLNIKPARGPLVKYLKEHKIGYTDSYHGGYTVSASAMGSRFQNVYVNEAMCQRAADVLQREGYDVVVYSRWD